MGYKADAAVSERRVKMHVFEPSGRSLWTVVGKGSEHWVDPDAQYCSCRAFYFAGARGRGECYHLESVRLAVSKDAVERIAFDDAEYDSFVSGVVHEL